MSPFQHILIEIIFVMLMLFLAVVLINGFLVLTNSRAENIGFKIFLIVFVPLSICLFVFCLTLAPKFFQ
jgi:hypothetical protein